MASSGTYMPYVVGGSCASSQIIWIYYPLMWIERGFGYVIIRSPYTPYSIYVRRTICLRMLKPSLGYSLVSLALQLLV